MVASAQMCNLFPYWKYAPETIDNTAYLVVIFCIVSMNTQSEL